MENILDVESEEDRELLLGEMRGKIDEHRYMVETAKEGKARIVVRIVATEIGKRSWLR